MNKLKRRLPLARCLFLLAMGVLSLGLGCSTAGTEFDTSKVKLIVKGTSTKNDIHSYFGDPLRTEVGPNGEVWTYTYVESHTTGAGVALHIVSDGNVNQSSTSVNKLSVVFDGDVVKDFLFDNSGHTDTAAR